ncbi:MAG: DUF1232 domain-containing protein [Elusimicrobia bacterium]|nr:DUF1232 domain-containing protein [Elusimicrobiota bacterium]
MTYKQLLALLDTARVSPEKAAAELGVSGMTLRRWRGKPAAAELPELYRRAFEPTVRRLVGEGLLHPEDPAVMAALAAPEEHFSKSVMAMGITHDILEQADKHQNTIFVGLARLGQDEKRQAQVKASGRMLARFKEMGEDWRKRLEDLDAAVRSTELPAIDKLVAFGALFYLITPFDLVPDAIPVFGLIDDFILAGVAALYYRKKFPALFGPKRRN